MSEPTLGHYVCSTVSSIVAIVTGTGLSYYLFIHPHLKNLELYKEKVKVYREVDRLITKVIISTENFMRDPSYVGDFGDDLERFNSYVRGENRLFVPDAVNLSFPDIIRAQEEVRPTEYKDPTEPQPAVDHLMNLLDAFQVLERGVETEIKKQPLQIPSELIRCVKRLRIGLSKLYEEWQTRRGNRR